MAAAVIAVVAAATVVLLNRAADEADVTTEPSPGTGWMIPTEIPAGWELLSVDTDFMDVEVCPAPCFLRTWSAREGGQAALTIIEGKLAEDVQPTGGRTVDLGPVSGLLGDEVSFGSSAKPLWRHNGTAVLVIARGIDEDEQIPAHRGPGSPGPGSG